MPRGRGSKSDDKLENSEIKPSHPISGFTVDNMVYFFSFSTIFGQSANLDVPDKESVVEWLRSRGRYSAAASGGVSTRWS